MKIAAPYLLLTVLGLVVAPRTVLSSTPACRDCETILEWKLYTSGKPTMWPVYLPPNGPATNTIDTPGYMTRIKENKCIPLIRVNDTDWNIMMYTDSTLKDSKCCNDTSTAPRDYPDLCAKFTLSKFNNATNSFDEVHTSYTELFWPWFLWGDEPCNSLDPPPASTPLYSENSQVYSCNPSFKINDAQVTLEVGTYRLEGATYNSGCPNRPSGQGLLPTSLPVSTSARNFTVTAKCP